MRATLIGRFLLLAIVWLAVLLPLWYWAAKWFAAPPIWLAGTVMKSLFSWVDGFAQEGVNAVLHTLVQVRMQGSQGDALGDIGLRISPKNPHEADVGYALLPEAQGKGYASEALRAVCEYGFTTLGVQAINAWVLGENRGSSRLLEKQGFVRTQVLEKAYHLNGVDYDDWIYRLEREAHPASADAG